MHVFCLRSVLHLRSSGRVKKSPVSVTPESLAEFRRRSGKRKYPLRLQVWNLGAERVCAPPVERKGEKISAVRNVRKPRAGWRGDLRVLVFAQAERAAASLRRVGDETVAAVLAPIDYRHRTVGRDIAEDEKRVLEQIHLQDRLLDAHGLDGEALAAHDLERAGLGRVITQGSPQPNTGVPGVIAGYGKERVIHSPAAGMFRSDRTIGDIVSAGDVIGYAGDTPMVTQIDGCLRGLLADGVQVTEGFKCADVDPRGDASYINYISDKATSVGGGVLEALAMLTDVFRG